MEFTAKPLPGQGSRVATLGSDVSFVQHVLVKGVEKECTTDFWLIQAIKLSHLAGCTGSPSFHSGPPPPQLAAGSAQTHALGGFLMVLGMAPSSSTFDHLQLCCFADLPSFKTTFCSDDPSCMFLCQALSALGIPGIQCEEVMFHRGSFFLGPNSRSQLQLSHHCCCLHGLLFWDVQVLKQPCKF